MRKLISVINEKVIHARQRNSTESSRRSDLHEHVSQNFHRGHKQTSFSVNFPYRKDKIKQNLPINTILAADHALPGFSVPQKTKKIWLARCNFEGNQFHLVKTNSDHQQNVGQGSVNQLKSLGSNFQPLGAEIQLQNKFRQIVSEINKSVLGLYFYQKKLSKEAPFELNIGLAFFLIIVFIFGLVGLEIFKQFFQPEEIYTRSFLVSFLALLIGAYLINLWVGLKAPYHYFNFDYETISLASKKLNEDNNWFKQRGYCLKCDIQMTWILLKPITNQTLSSEQLTEK